MYKLIKLIIQSLMLFEIPFPKDFFLDSRMIVYFDIHFILRFRDIELCIAEDQR